MELNTGQKADLTTTIHLDEARRVAARFDLRGTLQVRDFSGKGNIHRNTFLVEAEQDGRRSEYLLQMLNTDVFPYPDRVMNGWRACLEAQKKALKRPDAGRVDGWELIHAIPTREGNICLKTGDAGNLHYWRLMSRIPKVHCYKSLGEIQSKDKRIEIAEEAGRGLALFQCLTSAIDPENIPAPLPGYRNTLLYYAQLDSVLANVRTVENAYRFHPLDPSLRHETARHFLVHLNSETYRRRLQEKQVQDLISTAMENKAYGLRLQKGLLDGTLKKTIVHGDTKLDNFLFHIDSGKVAAIVDLDTVMAHTWLSDWGDMARSVITVSGEVQNGEHEVEIDMTIFKALARGYLGSATELPHGETALMTDAARIMSLELGVRFLTDYMRGDTYFKLNEGMPEDLNRTRAAVQFSLFRKLGEKAQDAELYIQSLLKQ
ncbi:MAG: phosphotransferase [Acidobacteriota bacterium]